MISGYDEAHLNAGDDKPLPISSKDFAESNSAILPTKSHSLFCAMIGVTPKKWAAPKYPKQLSTGVSTVTVIGIHRVIPPPKELIFAMKVIKQDSIDIPYNKGKKGVKKKDLAKSLFGNNNNVALTKLQRTITQPLQDTWLAIKIIKVGRHYWISLTKEGRYLRYVLDKQETY